MEDSIVASNLLRVQDVVTSSDFDEWRHQFVRKNIDAFSYEDENKLIYTDIHMEYEAEIERRVSACLGQSYAAFMKALPDYLEGAGRQNEAIGKAVTLLLEASDYNQFKEMMLFTKREKEERAEAKSSGTDVDNSIIQYKVSGQEITSFDIGGMMEMCANLSSAAEDEEGWVNVFKNDWMKICKRPVEASKRVSPSEIYLRGAWTMNLSVVQAADMMFTMDLTRRKNWDTNLSRVELPLGGRFEDDDVVTKAILDFGNARLPYLFSEIVLPHFSL